jgi:hypothetical protein
LSTVNEYFSVQLANLMMRMTTLLRLVLNRSFAGDLAQATAASRFQQQRLVLLQWVLHQGRPLLVLLPSEAQIPVPLHGILSMLQNAAAGDPNSPYFQRQTYRPTFMNTQSPYGGLPSAEASLAMPDMLAHILMVQHRVQALKMALRDIPGRIRIHPSCGGSRFCFLLPASSAGFVLSSSS